MYKYLIAFVTLTPLIGIWLVERGEYASSVGVDGEANGATAAFATYVIILLLTAMVSGGAFHGIQTSLSKFLHPEKGTLVLRDREFIKFSRNLSLFTLMFLLTMLFGFGGINVWFGTIEKGLFRATLGPLGAVAYLLTKFLIPAAFAYSTLLYMRSSKSWKVRRAWIYSIFLVFLVGSTWGFKTSGVFMLLPGLLILDWKLSLKKLVVLTIAFVAVLWLSFMWFDAQLMEGVDVLTFLFGRLTIMQGDVAWYVWSLYVSGEAMPDYWPTLAAAFGDSALTFFGLSKQNLDEWMGFHYDWMITNLAGTPLENIANGHNVTATPFAEGLVAGGWWGVLLFATLGGLLVGRTYYYLDRSIKTGRNVAAAVLSTYFCFHIFPWLNGGAVTQLFHVSVLVYVLLSYELLNLMRRLSASGYSIALPNRMV